MGSPQGGHVPPPPPPEACSDASSAAKAAQDEAAAVRQFNPWAAGSSRGRETGGGAAHKVSPGAGREDDQPDDLEDALDDMSLLGEDDEEVNLGSESPGKSPTK